MSLKNKFKTDAAAAVEGVWFEYSPNADGTIPAFKLARVGKQNKKYVLLMRAIGEKYAGANGLADFSSLSYEASEQVALELFIDSILVDWRNIQPEDDGKALAFTRENAMALLGSPDWADLYADLEEKAGRAASFREKVLQAQAKNS